MSRIKEIYESLVQGTSYMNEISKETENEIMKLVEDGLEKNQKEYEAYRDKLYSVMAIAEEGGFIKGFCFAVELLAECKLERKCINAKF